MKIKSLQLQNFKRFTDLTLQDIPENAKLVLLIGSNGSGKSSVFDGFEVINKRHLKDEVDFFLNEFNWNYYRKNTTDDFEIRFQTYRDEKEQIVTSNQSSLIIRNNSFYGRTSFRQASRLTRKGNNGNVEIELDNDRPRYFIDKDERFENDIEVIAQEILKDVFRSNKTTQQIKQLYINPLNKAFQNVFSSSHYTPLQVIEIIPPLDGKVAQIKFKKGIDEFHYDLLCAGEKEIFNIFLNLLARKQFHKNTIYFFEGDSPKLDS
jgi:energy-coupling factor transporter ATP-binding protein EcfA2